MRFIFLGTGTSAGVPAIGCECRVCRSIDPRDARLRSGAAVCFRDAGGAERVVLIDATPDLRQQALRAGLARCDAILFTHNHVDHTFGLDEVRRFNVLQKSPIDVFAEDHTMEHLRRVYKHIFDKAANVNDSFVATLIPRVIPAADVNARAIELYGMMFTPIRLLHGRLPIVGYRVEPGPRLKAGASGGVHRSTSEGRALPPAPSQREGEPDPWPLAYCTDVSAVPPETWPMLRGLRTLVLDALRHRHHPTHLTLADAVNIAERVGAERTYFTHIAHDLSHEETNAGLPEAMRLAHDGLVLGGVETAVTGRRVDEPDEPK